MTQDLQLLIPEEKFSCWIFFRTQLGIAILLKCILFQLQSPTNQLNQRLLILQAEILN
jgi:Tfp pilus assembly protein PilN